MYKRQVYARPNVARYFGERYAYVPVADDEVEVRMTRVVFAVTCEVADLTGGRIRVEIEGTPGLFVDSRSEVHTASEVYTLGNSCLLYTSTRVRGDSHFRRTVPCRSGDPIPLHDVAVESRQS